MATTIGPMRCESERETRETIDHNLLDKAGRSYWERVWEGQPVPPIPEAVDPRKKSLRNHVERRFHEYFVRAFADRDPAAQDLLEVGGGSSRWLPYFATEFGFHVASIDYSPVGCDRVDAILRQAGVSGRVVLADFFTPPHDLLEAFDVVVSFGLVEHYTDTTACVASLARFLRPGGLLITSIPNLTGGVGWIQKRVCRSIYDIHVPIARAALHSAHEQAGLHVLSCAYFMSGDFSAMNLSCWRGSPFYGAVLRLPLALSMASWLLERRGMAVRPNRLTSPFLICAARK